MNELKEAWQNAIHNRNKQPPNDYEIRECKDICTREEIATMNKERNLQTKYNMELRELINFVEASKSGFSVKQYKLMLESLWNLINEAKSFGVYIEDDLNSRLIILEQEYSNLFIANNRKIIDSIQKNTN